MKALVFLLVLANLLFYAFGAGYFGRTAGPDADRIDHQVVPERMRIVSRGEAPAKAAEPAKPDPAPAPAVPVAEEAKAEPAGKPEPVLKPEPAPKADAVACLLWEHLAPADADRLNALLAERFAGFKVARRAVEGDGGWWVFIPPLAGKAEADKKAGELRQLGITDYFIIQEGPSRHAISLGVFSSEKGSQERLAELKGKGVRSARLTPRPGKDGTVSLQASGPAGTRPALLAAAGKVLAKSDPQACK